MRHAEKSLFDFGPLARQYEQWYETLDGQALDRAQKEDARHLLGPAARRERLLDVGCGTGHWSSFFAEMGYQVTGIDISPEMIEVARAAVPDGSFQIADACELPFADGSFDVVASMATLEFVSDPAAAVREMVRCAKPGGRLLVGTLNRLAPLNQQRLSKGRQPYASANLFSPGELRRLLASLGSVRMAASSPRRHEGQLSPSKHAAARAAMSRKKLAGPLVVAEVRL